ncbi:MAG: DUF2723 domain-containing protein [Chloroflexi bacterium]|nr:DUF2723 domain-containing protein [Chloroflexota bacterium]
MCLFGGTLLVYARTLAPSLTWEHGGADGGDLVSAAASLGVPHPPGYPSYILLARLFLALPVGDEAYRLNAMSAVFASAATGLFYYMIVTGDAGRADWIGRVSAGVAALLLAFTPMVWSQAVIAEVYTLHLCLTAAICLAVQRWRCSPRSRNLLLVGALLGIGLGNHLTFGLIVPSLVLGLWDGTGQPSLHWRGGGLSLVRVAIIVLGCMLGLSVYGYLPLAARFGAASHWGPLDTPTALVTQVSAELYHGYLFSVPLDDLLKRLFALPLMALAEFQPWGAAAIIAGLVQSLRRHTRWSLSMLLLGMGAGGFAVSYNTTDSYRYLMPLWFSLACFLAVGLRAALDALVRARRTFDRFRMREGAAMAAVLLVLIWPVATMWARYPAMDLSTNREAERLMVPILDSLPTGALLLSGTDRQTFALWYYTEVRGVRRDIVVVDRDLLGYAPYRQHLTIRWHGLSVPPDGQADSLIAANRAQAPIFSLSADGAVVRLSSETSSAN